MKNFIFIALIMLLAACATLMQPSSSGWGVVEQTLVSKGWDKGPIQNGEVKSQLYLCHRKACGVSVAMVMLVEIEKSKEEQNQPNDNQAQIRALLKKNVGSAFKAMAFTRQEKINTSPKGHRFHITTVDEEGDKAYWVMDMREFATKAMFIGAFSSTPQNALKAYQAVPVTAFFSP